MMGEELAGYIIVVTIFVMVFVAMVYDWFKL